MCIRDRLRMGWGLLSRRHFKYIVALKMGGPLPTPLSITIYTIVHWRVQECTGIYKSVQECTGMYKNAQEYTRVYNVQDCTGVYRSAP